MGKHDKTLLAIFAKPTRANIAWRDIESLLKNRGAVVEEAEGSRVNVALSGRVITLHRPHPRPEASKAQVECVREFLMSIGIEP